MSWIYWCKCHRAILTTRQAKGGMPCALCQKETQKRKEKETLTGGENGRINKAVSIDSK